jgi:hypothetical protein
MEHASMLIEWMRRHNADFAGHLKTYLFTDRPITQVEKAAEAADAAGGAGSGGGDAASRIDLTPTIGSLKGHR